MGFIETSKPSWRIPYDDEQAVGLLEQALDKVFSAPNIQNILIICVGTDRSTGDAFGPIVGTQLTQGAPMPYVQVKGTLENPVHAVNLSSTLEEVRNSYSHTPFILAIDACLGRFDHVGHITLEPGPLRPGAGVKKNLPEFGDMTLTGVVNVSGFMEYFVLQNTRLGIVMKMSEIVVQSLKNSLWKFQIRKNMSSSLHTS
ncbi:spore protease YyaC [Alicyclobacillus tolerans]|uniref:Sporulation protein YyaC n=2 Tax=Alicyclobacillus tolerans TaxID=90970 RepID=A0ABT9LUF7_9BACL|nr:MULTISPECIES: spore protease YyaC [Alicyclobacillus]MDP9727891.1 putative sporulation protein YyaC [Alicyclobacillus tengchongensis]QRF24532.1 spore protease YyaC [Alicyclobacillus sp. TC]SHK51366.1 putative sporulation protein YyaC [Alicyclobacillus montanus]